MAGEIRINNNFKYDMNDQVHEMNLGSFTLDVTADTPSIRHRQSVGITEEALVLGDVDLSVGGGWMVGRALGSTPTEFIELRQATAAAEVIRFVPGDPPCSFRLDNGTTAPFVIAAVANELDYIIIPLPAPV